MEALSVIFLVKTVPVQNAEMAPSLKYLIRYIIVIITSILSQNATSLA